MNQVTLSTANFVELGKLAKKNRRSKAKEADIAVEQYIASTKAIEKALLKRAAHDLH